MPSLDAARERAVAALQSNVGTQPRQLLGASDDALRTATGTGILADQQMAKLRRIAQPALEDDPERVPTLPLREAKRALNALPRNTARSCVDEPIRSAARVRYVTGAATTPAPSADQVSPR
ncbi:MAG TPA: hypothetical protein VGL99_07025 [Chloroflexota bacterium]|jgi:hypothetical protein